MIQYWRLLIVITCCLCITAPAIAQQTHVVSSGDSLYGIVALHYPKRMSRWTDVAADLVELNPEAFPDGLDTVLKLGDVLVLVDYTQSNQTDTSPSSTPEANLDRVREITKSTTGTTGRSDTTPTAIENTATPMATQPQDALALNDAETASNVVRGSTTGVIVGTVTTSTQPAWAIDHSNQQRLLAVNERIYLGDAITTSHTSDLSIRMLDAAEVYLLPNSRLMFETYHYDEKTKRGGTVMTLVKGGFRMTSGLIGQHNPDAVAVNTAVAAVGITGTEFGLRICALDACQAANDNRTLEPGLYSGVLEGAIVLSNNTGDYIAKRGEFFYVAAPSTKPKPAPDAANLLFNPVQLASLGAPAQVNQPLGFWGWLKRKIFGN